MTLRVLIADDELMARKRLHRLLGAIEGTQVVDECEDGEEVLSFLKTTDVDVVLLDINMPNLSGVDAMGLIGEDGPAIVFTTAHSAHAVQAFEGGAVDYLLKPIDSARLVKALNRVRQRLDDTSPLERIPVSTRKGVLLVNPGEISHAIIDGESVLLHTVGGTVITDYRLADLQRRLSGNNFERVHRRVLVNLEFLERLEPVDSGGYIAHMRDGSRVSVSRQAARRLRKRWTLPR
ncbi:MAG: response regulator transcription factor [Proteobacteria bacterium]|jgi:two-component system, LytTR family, response regulator|nr:response regulator transcription factor [Pseudomonadota bacterium]